MEQQYYKKVKIEKIKGDDNGEEEEEEEEERLQRSEESVDVFNVDKIKSMFNMRKIRFTNFIVPSQEAAGIVMLGNRGTHISTDTMIWKASKNMIAHAIHGTIYVSVNSNHRSPSVMNIVAVRNKPPEELRMPSFREGKGNGNMYKAIPYPVPGRTMWSHTLPLPVAERGYEYTLNFDVNSIGMMYEGQGITLFASFIPQSPIEISEDERWGVRITFVGLIH